MVLSQSATCWRRINFQPGMEQSKGHKGDVPTPGDERRDFFGVRRGPMKIPTDRSEPGGWGLAGGSITLLGIIGAIVLITAVFSLSLGWTIGLNIGLVIVGLVFAGATIEGWRDRRLFRDTAVVVPGKIFQRMHEQHEDSYREVSHEYYLLVEFMNGRRPIRLKWRVNEARYQVMCHGSSVAVRFAPSKPELARFE